MNEIKSVSTWLYHKERLFYWYCLAWRICGVSRQNQVSINFCFVMYSKTTKIYPNQTKPNQSNRHTFTVLIEQILIMETNNLIGVLFWFRWDWMRKKPKKWQLYRKTANIRSRCSDHFAHGHCIYNKPIMLSLLCNDYTKIIYTIHTNMCWEITS